MKRIALAIAIAATTLLAGHAAAPEPARCFYCPSFGCYDSSSCGGGGCVCIQSQPYRRGSCMYISPRAE